jgi:hypothetical protein
VLDTHPATEPSGTHVRDVGGTNFVFQYGAVLPAFDGWRTHESTREYLSLDKRWRFPFDPGNKGLGEGWQSPRFDDTAWGRVDVPSAWDLLDTPGFGSETTPFGKGTAFADGYAWYRTVVDVPGSWRARHVRIAFLAAGYSAEVWLDGVHLGKHEGANSPFALPVAGALRPGTRQTVAVRVFRRASHTDYTASAPQPVTDDHEIPYKPVDYWPYAGLTRSAWIEAVPRVTIAKLLVAGANGCVEARAVIENHGASDFDGRLTLDPGRDSGGRPTVVEARIAARSAGVGVDGLVHADEVRRDRHVRGDPAQDLLLRQVALEQGVVGEPGEVQLLGGVGEGRREPRWQHLVEAVVELGPERRRPGVVERLDVAVPLGQPAPEVGGRLVAPAHRGVAAVLVADVPHLQRGVVGVPGGQPFDQVHGVLAVDAAGGAVVLASAGPHAPAPSRYIHY